MAAVNYKKGKPMEWIKLPKVYLNIFLIVVRENSST